MDASVITARQEKEERREQTKEEKEEKRIEEKKRTKGDYAISFRILLAVTPLPLPPSLPLPSPVPRISSLLAPLVHARARSTVRESHSDAFSSRHFP